MNKKKGILTLEIGGLRLSEELDHEPTGEDYLRLLNTAVYGISCQNAEQEAE